MLVPRPRSVMIDPIDDADESPGGIIIPEMAKERTKQGIVKYVGSDCKLVSIGDWVLFNGYAGVLIFLEGEGRLISMDERDINCICGPSEWAATTVPGLYNRGGNNQYFNTTFESALAQLKEVAAAFMSQHVKRSMKKPDAYFKPSVEDIDRATNWTERVKK
jgi:chaperonin GroES